MTTDWYRNRISLAGQSLAPRGHGFCNDAEASFPKPTIPAGINTNHEYNDPNPTGENS